MKFKTNPIVDEVFQEFLQPGCGLPGWDNDQVMRPHAVLQVSLAYFCRWILKIHAGYTDEQIDAATNGEDKVLGILDLYLRVSKARRGVEHEPFDVLNCKDVITPIIEDDELED
jgi:hypothetical protein